MASSTSARLPRSCLVRRRRHRLPDPVADLAGVVGHFHARANSTSGCAPARTQRLAGSKAEAGVVQGAANGVKRPPALRRAKSTDGEQLSRGAGPRSPPRGAEAERPREPPTRERLCRSQDRPVPCSFQSWQSSRTSETTARSVSPSYSDGRCRHRPTPRPAVICTSRIRRRQCVSNRMFQRQSPCAEKDLDPHDGVAVPHRHCRRCVACRLDDDGVGCGFFGGRASATG